MSGAFMTNNGWGHKGEKLQLFSEEGQNHVQWTPVNVPGEAITWYKTYFNIPEGHDPVALRFTGLGKGMA
ncbi:hypothetical protein MLD38_032324 [Melastoma candidum]|uniref:Uncharacterized protein n=1 Tax=Melastoma candidum TaxID=119954 RepID=A0ACB9M3X4_9MYRT|nr:hypothetical protein MLD38_032324 [Melastoma candidum]